MGEKGEEEGEGGGGGGGVGRGGGVFGYMEEKHVVIVTVISPTHPYLLPHLPPSVLETCKRGHWLSAQGTVRVPVGRQIPHTVGRRGAGQGCSHSSGIHSKHQRPRTSSHDPGCPPGINLSLCVE